MNHRKAKATRQRRTAIRPTVSSGVAQWSEEPKRLQDAFLSDEDDLGTYRRRAAGVDHQWDRLNVQREALEEIMLDAPALEEPELDEPEEVKVAEDFRGVERSVFFYLQEVGTVPLLTREDEIRIARQIQELKARLREAVEAHASSCPRLRLCAVAKQTNPDGSVRAVLRQMREWAARIERGERAGVQREFGLNPQKLLRIWQRLHNMQTALEEARATMAQANLRLVVAIAKHYVNSGLPLLDLIQEGNIGLMRAVEKFDPQRGCRLSTYASWWIRQAIARAVTEQARTVNVPMHVSEHMGQYKRVGHRLRQQLEREPSAQELADALQLSVEKVRTMEARSQPLLSLETPLADGHNRLGDFLADRTFISPADAAIKEELRRYVHSCIKRLSPREEYIVCARFGLDGREALTLDAIGKGLQLSRERVRQLEARALKKLRHRSRNRRLDGFLEN